MFVVSVVVAALYLGRAIAIPIAIAVLISFSLGPAVTWLRRHHFGRAPSIVIAVVPALLALTAFAYVVTTQVGLLAENLPSYQTNIEAKVNSVANALPARGLLDRGSAALRRLRASFDGEAAPQPAHPHNHAAPLAADGDKPIAVEIERPEPGPLDLVRSILGPLVEPVADAGLVLLFVILFLAERETLRDRIIRLAGARDLHRTTMAMDEAGKRLSRFMLLQTVVNVAFGFTITLGLYLIGLPNAALWGGIAAMMRFIPYLGVAAASVLPLLVAFAVDPGWTMLVWTAGLFLALELVVGNLIEPWLYGTSTGLSAAALIVSVIFWTWLWGTIGLLLATPLTVCIAVIGRYVPQLAFLDILLGNQAPLKLEESFYQRLLAGDPEDAARQAEEFLKEHSFLELCEQVALPALRLAERDRLRGELDKDHMAQIASGVNFVFEFLAANEAKAAAKPGRPGKAAHEAEEARPPLGRPAEIVLCVGGRTDLDEAAAALLARLLENEGREAMALPHDAAIELSLPELDPSRVTTVCLSYLDPESVPHTRYLARRFRRRFGSEIRLIVALWGMEQNATQIEKARAETRADRVVVTLSAATEAIGAPASDDAPSLGVEPELSELAQRVSDVIERTA